MPRKLREDYDGAWHHVLNRGVAKSTVFRDGADREVFLRFLGEAAHRAALEVHGYCLLGNHYHLLIRSRDGRLSEGMRWLGGRYTQHVNYSLGRDGPLFRGRYTAVAIEGDAHLVRTSRYIHLNPVEAGLARSADAWAWSSAPAYLGSRAALPWLVTELILDMFGPGNSREAYRDFLSAGVDKQTSGIYARLLAIEEGVRPAGSDPAHPLATERTRR